MKSCVMKNNFMKTNHLIIAVLSVLFYGCKEKSVSLESQSVKIEWQNENGWKIKKIQTKNGVQRNDLKTPSGEFTLLYSERKPDSASARIKTNTGIIFPESIFKFQQATWKLAVGPVSLNTAGEAYHFYPEDMESGEKTKTFRHENDKAIIVSTWKMDERFPTDVRVEQLLIAKKAGYYSLATPSVLTVAEEDLSWASIPGYFQGNAIQKDSVLAYAYGQGIPSFPAIFPERCVSTLISVIDAKGGLSFSVIPSPGLGRDPWANDKATHDEWRLGFSHMNRRGKLSPTLYFPVLGEPQSLMKEGDTIRYGFRYSFQNGCWFQSVKHAANDIYKFSDALKLRSNKQSLINRAEEIHRYLLDKKTSLWHVETYQGLEIGAQSYLGGVAGSQGDAMKNADYGAMWMLAKATEDMPLKQKVLPYALNFKLTQQQAAPGFFQGAALGQYYLHKRKTFVEEWGEFVEPISLTYYTMLDMGNILLFEPDNKMLRERLKLGAERLLKWQKEDGSWEVAYDKKTEQPLFKDLTDLRPTFYGLLVAHRILKDEKYLAAAKKGADWMIENAVNKGHFLGVCGDARYAPDFATGQTSQAFLDLYDATPQKNYRDAAIQAAKIYTTSVYTHPVPTAKIKKVNGAERQDWEIAQAGLSFEHGGLFGSAQRHGPIQLASHAGLFVRIFNLTKDSLFLAMARSGAIGRDAFVDPKTSVASYYWNAMNTGPGPFPHHAWWQIGWIMDYLLSEAEVRSKGQIKFPRGFVTPKVGPHQSYGFESGKIFSADANLVIKKGLAIGTNPNIEIIAALSTDKKKAFLILMNDVGAEERLTVQYDFSKLNPSFKVNAIRELTVNAKILPSGALVAALDAYGLRVYEFSLTR